METFDLAEAAARVGIGPDELRRFCEIGVITPDTCSRPGHGRPGSSKASRWPSPLLACELKGLAGAMRLFAAARPA